MSTRAAGNTCVTFLEAKPIIALLALNYLKKAIQETGQPMSSENRPLSPHLQVYAFKLHMIISIVHRITGAALAFGAVALIYWLGAAAYGPESFASAKRLFGSWFGYLCLFGWSACLFFHLCNGLRHLLWDIGLGFEAKRLNSSGAMVLAGTFILTAMFWIIGLDILK